MSSVFGALQIGGTPPPIVRRITSVLALYVRQNPRAERMTPYITRQRAIVAKRLGATYRLFHRLAAGESGDALPEYAIVLAGLTIIATLAFTSVGKASTNSFETNANNFTNAGLVSYSSITP